MPEYIKRKEKRGRPANPKTVELIATLSSIEFFAKGKAYIQCEDPRVRQSLRTSSMLKKWRKANQHITVILETSHDGFGMWAIKKV